MNVQDPDAPIVWPPIHHYVCTGCCHNYVYTPEQAMRYAADPCTNCGSDKRPGMVKP